ncbi:MAG: long-chain fatty acid--CoA ligase [Opitutales bacterium]|nr:long-chain fatty acid--CoA ligase [Opitutales bacterium]MCH8541096.1 fatty acid--CoA ligase family protein [Opitutales bacterium]
MEEAHLILFLDGRSGEYLSYRDVKLEVAGERVSFCPICRPESPLAAVRAVVTAMVLGQELVLLDPGQTEDEVLASGLSLQEVNRAKELKGVNLPEDPLKWWDLVFPAHAFKLTLFTSGSSGRSKKASHSLEVLARMVRRSRAHRASVWGMGYHATHIAGIQVLLQALANGNPLISLHGMNAESFLSLVSRQKVTHLAGSPSFFRQIPKGSWISETVRSVTLGAEPARSEDFARLSELFPGAHLRNAYASTEAGTLLIGEGELFSIPLESKGLISIHDEQIYVAASTWGNNPDIKKEDRWISTGDRIAWEKNKPGWFRILGREGDSISTGGWQVNPYEVEAVLRELPGIEDCRVYGRANSLLGNVVAADIVCKATPVEIKDAEIRRYLAERLQDYKLPRFIRRVEEIPRTRTGKIRRLSHE